METLNQPVTLHSAPPSDSTNPGFAAEPGTKLVDPLSYSKEKGQRYLSFLSLGTNFLPGGGIIEWMDQHEVELLINTFEELYIDGSLWFWDPIVGQKFMAFRRGDQAWCQDIIPPSSEQDLTDSPPLGNVNSVSVQLWSFEPCSRLANKATRAI